MTTKYFKVNYDSIWNPYMFLQSRSLEAHFNQTRLILVLQGLQRGLLVGHLSLVHIQKMLRLRQLLPDAGAF